MEDGLRGQERKSYMRGCITSLNPCFNGRWSASFRRSEAKNADENVLILVLMEDGLRVLHDGDVITIPSESLNPCFNGRWSASLNFRKFKNEY